MSIMTQSGTILIDIFRSVPPVLRATGVLLMDAHLLEQFLFVRLSIDFVVIFFSS
jgi:hypothetical protein